jgi:hypothetical protein
MEKKSKEMKEKEEEEKWDNRKRQRCIPAI